MWITNITSQPANGWKKSREAYPPTFGGRWRFCWWGYQKAAGVNHRTTFLFKLKLYCRNEWIKKPTRTRINNLGGWKWNYSKHNNYFIKFYASVYALMLLLGPGYGDDSRIRFVENANSFSSQTIVLPLSQDLISTRRPLRMNGKLNLGWS